MTSTIRGLGLLSGMAAAAVLAGAFGRAADDKADKKTDAKGEVVKTVLSVDTKLEVTKPPVLIVTAVGEVPTGGWTGAKLTRRTYIKPPADGVYEYDLTAVPPTGAATQVVSKVKAKDEWKDPPEGVKGVKVYGVGEGVKAVQVGKKEGK
jgi:hypothetical protein